MNIGKTTFKFKLISGRNHLFLGLCSIDKYLEPIIIRANRPSVFNNLPDYVELSASFINENTQ